MISRSFGGLFFILLDIVMRSRQLLNSADLRMFLSVLIPFVLTHGFAIL